MVRIPLVISCAFAAAVAQADVTSSWTSFSWSSTGGATYEEHQVVRRDDGQMQEQVEKLTSDDVMTWLGKVFEQIDVVKSNMQQLASDGTKVLEDAHHAKETLGKRMPTEVSSVYKPPGLRGTPSLKRMHVPCHHGQPKAKAGAGGFELKDSMTLVVNDPEAFVADERSSQAVAAAIAQAYGVDPKDVHVTLSVGSGPAPAKGSTSIVSPALTETQGVNGVLFKLAPFAVALLSMLFFSAACLAPIVRRRRKAAAWERQLRAGSRLEALYEGEWSPGTLSTGQRTAEGYWVVQCDVDIDGQLLYSMDIRPEGVASIAASQATPKNDMCVGLMPQAIKTPVLAQHGKADQLAEKTAVQAYLVRLFEREAAAEEVRAAHAYSSRIIVRAFLA